MKNLVLYFFSFVLKILFNLIPNIVYKCNRFSKALFEKGFKFMLGRRSGFFSRNLGFILLLAETNLFFEKQSYKKDMFVIFKVNGFEMVFALLAKVVTFHIFKV